MTISGVVFAQEAFPVLVLVLVLEVQQRKVNF